MSVEGGGVSVAVHGLPERLPGRLGAVGVGLHHSRHQLVGPTPPVLRRLRVVAEPNNTLTYIYSLTQH